MYRYMSWHVLLACIVQVQVIYYLLYFRSRKLCHIGTVGGGGGGEHGGVGGIEQARHPIGTYCSGETRPGAEWGGGGGCLLGCM